MALTTKLYIGAAVKITGDPGYTEAYLHLMNGGSLNPDGGLGTGQLASRRSFQGAGSIATSFATSTADSQIYGTFGGTTYDDDRDLGVKESWLSFKPDVSSFIAGNEDNNLIALINSWPAGHRGLLTLWHEPEDNFTTTTARDNYRKMMRRFHWIVATNRGTKDLRAGPIWKGLLLDEDASPTLHGDLSWFFPVYQTSDITDFGIPAGWAVGDPAFDFVGIDFYDKDRSWYWAKREWDPLVGGNPLGLTGYLDKLVTEAQLTKPSYTRSDLVWALGEIGTKRDMDNEDPHTGPSDDWFEEIVTKAIADDSTCLTLSWFHNDTEGQDAPWDMTKEVQAWIKANGTEFDQGQNAIGFDTYDEYDVDAGTTLVSQTFEMQYKVAGLASADFEMQWQAEGQASNEFEMQWRTDQYLPVIPDAARRTPASGRLASGTPIPRRPGTPGTEPT